MNPGRSQGGVPWVISMAVDAPFSPDARADVEAAAAGGTGADAAAARSLELAGRGTAARDTEPVRFSPVFCSSQSAARSLAAPSVSPLFSSLAPSESW